MHPGSHCRGLSLLTYLCIHRFLQRAFDFREESQGVAAAVAEPKGTLGEEGVVIRGRGHRESLWPGFGGVVEDSHHHLQQPQGGGRHKGLATLGADLVWYLQSRGGENLFVHPIFDKIKLHQYFPYTHLFCSLLGNLGASQPNSSLFRGTSTTRVQVLGWEIGYLRFHLGTLAPNLSKASS